MTVVELKSRNKPKPDVWQCVCGSYTFRLYADAAVQCTDCGHEAVTMQGYWRTPASEPENQEHQGNIVSLFAKERDI